MKRVIFYGLLLWVMVLIICGCSQLTIEGSGTPTSDCNSQTVWQSYYGPGWSSYDEKKASNGVGLYQVTIHNNYLYSLITVFSLGIVAPQEVEWELQKPEPIDEDVEEMKPTVNMDGGDYHDISEK